MDVGAIVEIGFAQGPQKSNDGSGKMNYLGTIDRGFTVLIICRLGKQAVMKWVRENLLNLLCGRLLS
jgi:hypothetical protein